MSQIVIRVEPTWIANHYQEVIEIDDELDPTDPECFKYIEEICQDHINNNVCPWGWEVAQ